MRIGIDVTHLKLSPHRRSGLYTYIRGMVEGLYRIAFPQSITLFLANYPKPVDSQTYDELQGAFRNWPLKAWNVPRWAYKLRLRFSAYSRMEVFHFPTASLFFENITDRANVFTIPDLTFIHYPQHHQSGIVSTWCDFCDRAVEYGDAILTYSEHARQDVARTLGVPENKVHVTPLAAGAEFRPIPDRALLRRLLEPFGLQDQRYILSVGTLEPRKNHVRLIRAFSRLVQSDTILPHKLVFAGASGWQYEPIFDKVKEEGLEDRVLFLGKSDPLEALYNGADLMVYPSLYEGFGLPPLEAMACGTPVITSNRSSLPEVVGDAALTVEPEDEDAICEAMRQLLLDEKRREELSAKGMKRASHFTWERTAEATLEAYRAAHRIKY